MPFSKVANSKRKIRIKLEKGDYSGYISKWGIDSEMTKRSCKKAAEMAMLRRGDLLKMSMLEGGEQFGKLFQEFAICFKGSRQLDWSRGLKAMFSIDNKTDEELAEETEKLQ